MEKLAALVSTPRAHLVRFHGLLGPAASWRAFVVPHATDEAPPDSPDVTTASSVGNPADRCEAQAPSDPPQQRGARLRKNYTWSELMKRVFAADVLACTHCGGRLRILTTIRAPEVSEKILSHLGIPSRPPPLAPPVLQELPFPFE
jgi:hypothetical protein